MTALAAFLLHQLFLRKRSGRSEGHVLGTASSCHDSAAAAARPDLTSSETAPTEEVAETSTPLDDKADSQASDPDRTDGEGTSEAPNEDHRAEEPRAETDDGSTSDGLLEAIASPDNRSSSRSNHDNPLSLGGREFEAREIDCGSTTDQRLKAIEIAADSLPSSNDIPLVDRKDSSTEMELDIADLDEESQPKLEETVTLRSKAEHPDLGAYHRWKAIVTSLYRVYAVPLVGVTNPDAIREAVLPTYPSSERGNTALHVEVTNRTSHDVVVYWVDYGGNEVYKGGESDHLHRSSVGVSKGRGRGAGAAQVRPFSCRAFREGRRNNVSRGRPRFARGNATIRVEGRAGGRGSRGGRREVEARVCRRRFDTARASFGVS